MHFCAHVSTAILYKQHYSIIQCTLSKKIDILYTLPYCAMVSQYPKEKKMFRTSCCIRYEIRGPASPPCLCSSYEGGFLVLYNTYCRENPEAPARYMWSYSAAPELKSHYRRSMRIWIWMFVTVIGTKESTMLRAEQNGGK